MRTESLPIASLPHVSNLFHDYLGSSPEAANLYASPHPAPLSPAPLHDRDKRLRVSAILEEQNRFWGCGVQSLANIGRLRNGAAAVVTGQQVGLFGGPMYALLKAITAIKRARRLAASGVDAVPIFWLATEDHDLAEVAEATFVDPQGQLRRVACSPEAHVDSPVGEIVFGEELSAALDQAASFLGEGEVTSLLRDCYRRGVSFGEAFARFFTHLFKEYALILIDDAHPEFHRIAMPVYLQAAMQSSTLTGELLTRNKELERAGYTPQVKVTAGSTLLFVKVKGARIALRRVNDHYEAGEARFSQSELEAAITERPQDFTGNALLRPVVQDFLLPTSHYVGGPAEIAYFAQSAVVYQRILGRVTPIVPRISATLIEPCIERRLKKFGLRVEDAFQTASDLRAQLAVQSLSQHLKQRFESARGSVGANLEGLWSELQKTDPTLINAAQRSLRKIKYQLDRLEQKAGNAYARRDKEIERHAALLSAWLYPHGGLQERGIAAAQFLSRRGSGLIDELMESLNDDCRDHQLAYLD